MTALLRQAYAVALYLYPPSFRQRHGQEMRQFLAADLANRGPSVRVLARAAGDLVVSIPREWRRAATRSRAIRPTHLTHSRQLMTMMLLQDFRYAVRLLAKSPGFTVAAVAALALGIGANTAIFSLAEATIVRPVHVHQPERLAVWSWSSSYPDYQEYTKRTDVFDGVAAIGSAGRVNVVIDGAAELVPAAFVSGGTFDVLGVRTALGRTIGPADDVFNGPVVAVLAHDYWRTRFAGDPNVIGRTVRLNGAPVTIVGVLDRHFRGTSLASKPSVYVPTGAFPRLQTGFFSRVNALTARGFVWLTVIGRLRPDVSPESAASTMTALYAQLHPPPPGKSPEPLRLEPLSARALGRSAADVRRFVLLLAGAVGVTLLIGCANLANLLTARAAARRRDVGVRLALGATRGRVVRQVLLESVTLSTAGGVAGLAVAAVALETFSSLQLPGGIPIGPMGAQLSAPVLLATAALSVLTGVLFGAVPAWRTAGTDVLLSLRADPRTASSGAGIRGALLAAQVSLSLVLLTGAGLFTRSLQAALETDLGFDADRLLSVSTNTGLGRYDDARARSFYAEALARIRALPQVESAAWASMMPTRTSWVNQTTIEGYVTAPGEDVTVNMSHVGPGYFATLKTPVREGRELSAEDAASAPLVAVVNQSMADKYWKGRSAVGGRFEHHGRSVTVVGVVENSVDRDLRDAPRPFAYLSFDQWLSGKGSIATDSAHLFVRTRGETAAAIPLVREQMRALDPQLPLYDIAPFEDRVAALVMTQRMGVTLLGLLSALALALAAVGVYGVASYLATLRTREIGIRMALGSDRQRIAILIVKQSVMPIAAGIAGGTALALWAARAAASFLYGVRPGDPVTLLAAVSVIVSVGLLATYLPARRAARIDPMIALRID